MPTHQIKITNTILLDSNLSCVEKILLSEIIWLQDYNEKKRGRKYCEAGNFYFRSILNYKTDRPISDLITGLKQKGYIHEKTYINGNYRHLQYDFDKCFEKDVVLGLVKRDR